MDHNTLTQMASWDKSPDLMECDTFDAMDADNCDLEYWFQDVAQGTLKGLTYGYPPNSRLPHYMFDDGPLRTAMLKEMAFRFQCEVLATKSLTYLVSLAPKVDYMDFYATQIIDEARHAFIFRNHMLEMGITPGDLDEVVEASSKQELEEILLPMEEWALTILKDQSNFYGGVAIITILLEGVLAPTAALSEKKWRPLDERAADLQKGANIDEIRHLNVGSSIIKKYVQSNPANKEALLAVIAEGKKLWEGLPVSQMIYARELLFQEGMESQSSLLESYELIPGLRLLDSSVNSRLQLAFSWSEKLQASRMKFMGLDDIADI